MFDTTTRLDNTVSLWLSAQTGVPERLVWRGQRWRVSDTPTPLDILAGVTHPPAIHGWRFQITPDDGGPSVVVDVLRSQDSGEWAVVRTWP